MKHISIIVPQGHSSLPNIDGAYQIFTEVNNLAQKLGNPALFTIKLVGLSVEVGQRNGLFIVHPDCLIGEVAKTDLIIIPAMQGDLQLAIERNTPFFPWIIQSYRSGAELASFCVGSFFLAATGLLNGKQCATHWSAAEQFRQLYPKVNLVDDKIITHEDKIYTSGGAYSFLNLLVYIIEKYAGREIAIMIAKIFMIDIDHTCQSPFILFQGQKEHEDHDIKNAQLFIEGNYPDKITVDQLATKFTIGRRSFERRFKKATNNTVIEYLQRVKIEAAKRSFESSRKNISEVMFDVGYTDNKAFREVFKKITGLTPIEYRNKYNKQLLSW